MQISLTRIFKTLILEFQFRLKQNTTELQVYFSDYLRVVGEVETLVCALVIDKGIIPPTTNYETPDPNCNGIDFVPNEAREKKIQNVMSNSFGFGGHNVSLVLGKLR